jgi:hypothetical protein
MLTKHSVHTTDAAERTESHGTALATEPTG